MAASRSTLGVPFGRRRDDALGSRLTDFSQKSLELHRLEPDQAGRLIVSPGGDGIVTDDTVPIKWAIDESTTGDQYDVRFRINGGGWRTWKRNTAKRRGVFGRNDSPVNYRVTKLYELQARSEKSANPKRHSGWSGSFLFGNTPF